MLSVLATNSLNGHVSGINDLQAEYNANYGPGDYAPNIAVTYWTFRLMVGVALLSGLVGLLACFFWRRGTLGRQRWFTRVALAAIVLPLIGNFTGWIFTEMGRQPWVVFGLLRTANASSPSVDAISAWVTLIGFTALYGALAVVTFRLVLRHVRDVPGAVHGGPEDDSATTVAPAY